MNEKRSRLIQVADELRRSSNSMTSESSEATLKAIPQTYFKEDFRLTPAFFQIKDQEKCQEMSETLA